MRAAVAVAPPSSAACSPCASTLLATLRAPGAAPSSTAAGGKLSMPAARALPAPASGRSTAAAVEMPRQLGGDAGGDAGVGAVCDAAPTAGCRPAATSGAAAHPGPASGRDGPCLACQSRCAWAANAAMPPWTASSTCAAAAAPDAPPRVPLACAWKAWSRRRIFFMSW
jgi:hypothetical protein